MSQDKYDVLKLGNQLCFPLYACSREIIKKYKPCLDNLNLTYTQYITMLVLWEKRTMTAKELGDILHLDSGTLTPLLKKLECKGLLIRRRSEADERNLIVTVTENGEALKEKAMPIPETVKNCFNLTEEEAKTLYRILYRIIGQAEAELEID
ncbi:MAG: MarR family transcriptional regulator [Oscillospiraceae bacterium]|nr:MarR family transcriptional regulator [Oscillospiraceae bacterium]